MKRNSFLLLMVAALATFVLVACGSKKAEKTSEDTWATIEKNKTITIGFDNTFVPMGFEDKSGENVGFDIDLATAVFDKYGITIKWQPIDWDLKETELNNGNIDLIWNGYTATAERRKKVLFTEEYMANIQVLVTKKSSGIDSVAGMKDKVVGAQAGSSGYEAFESQTDVLKDLVKDNTATQYSTFNEALIDLQNDRIDGLMIDRVYANYYLKQEGILGDYNVMELGFKNESFAVGARKGDKTLVENINKALKELYADGTFGTISEKWFGEDVAADGIKN